ncbi:hypothetical protein ACO229_17765 [Promicromonospora sp. MS192]|uniref:hypothetical protein n=1 Tax=Promicromonospora sp. MS192 TaxID=3412684 RepID=UPI003C2BD323
MPSPVSPDAGVPEHQPDQRRPRTGGTHRQEPNGPPPSGGRPQSGQFASGQFASGQFPAGQGQSGQATSGQLPSRQFPAGQGQSGQATSGQFPSAQFPSAQFPSGQLPSRQFPAGNQPQSGPFGAGRPQSGPFATPPGAASPSDPRTPDPRSPGPDGAGEERGRKGTTRRDWIWSIVAFVVAAVVIGAVGFHFFGPDADEEPTVAWAVDSCAGPDPAAQATDAPTDAYRPLTCDDAEATVTVLDIQDAVSVAQLHCPAGTDVVFQKDGQAGGDTQAVCARNLSDDHPGDPGMGGGQLLAGDCVNGDGGEVPCSADGARKVTGLLVGAVECPEGTADEIELGFDPSRSYETICLGE